MCVCLVPSLTSTLASSGMEKVSLRRNTVTLISLYKNEKILKIVVRLYCFGKKGSLRRNAVTLIVYKVFWSFLFLVLKIGVRLYCWETTLWYSKGQHTVFGHVVLSKVADVHRTKKTEVHVFKHCVSHLSLKLTGDSSIVFVPKSYCKVFQVWWKRLILCSHYPFLSLCLWNGTSLKMFEDGGCFSIQINRFHIAT